jgi:hypothetical protein
MPVRDRAVDRRVRLARQRILLLAGIAIYVASFQWVYVNWLFPVFGYFGYDYNPPGFGYLLLAWTLSLLPAVWLPLNLSRPSQLAYWVLYITVIIPSMFVPLYAGLDRPSEVVPLMLVLFAGFCIVGLSYLVPLRSLKPPELSRSRFWFSFSLLAGSLAVWTIVALRSKLRVLSFADIYDVRLDFDAVMEGTSLNYAIMWLSGAINPFLMGWGLYHKRRWIFLVGVLGQVLVYSGLGTKGSILSPVFILGFYLLLRPGRLSFSLKLTWSVVILIVGLALTYVISGSNMSPLQYMLMFVVFTRVFSINGLMTAQYYNFFQSNPLTYYSHVKGLNWFVNYPYANPLGIEVGSFYSGDPTLDSTAHFWAPDGLAALGLPGIIVISVFCACIFWALDSLAGRHDVRLAALLISYAAYNIANISIFTSLLSGGLGLLMVFLYFMPEESGGIAPSPIVASRLVVAR